MYTGAQHGFDWRALSNGTPDDVSAYQAARTIVYDELAFIKHGPEPRPGIVFGTDIQAPGIFFDASSLAKYTIYRLRSDGTEEKVAAISSYDGQVAIPLTDATDRIEDYVIEYDLVKSTATTLEPTTSEPTREKSTR